MGTDVRAHIEIKVDGKWELYSSPYIPRNYELFSRMAGVREHPLIPPIAPPRGFPEDLAPLTRRLVDHRDVSDASWLSGDELNEVIEDFTHPEGRFYSGFDSQQLITQMGFGYLQGNSFGKHRSVKWVEDVRVVFYFD
jgi:hypothetical protein